MLPCIPDIQSIHIRKPKNKHKSDIPIDFILVILIIQYCSNSTTMLPRIIISCTALQIFFGLIHYICLHRIIMNVLNFFLVK